MGIDITCILENRLSNKEVLALPKEINNWIDLQSQVKKEIANLDIGLHDDKILKPIKWEDNIDQNDLEKSWDYFEEKNGGTFAKDIWFSTYFGLVEINRNTIIISPFNLKFKALQGAPKRVHAILNIMEVIGLKLKTPAILYCADSSTNTEVLSDLALNGSSLEEILTYASIALGVPKKDKFAALNDTYYVQKLS